MKKVLLFSSLILGLGLAFTSASAAMVPNQLNNMKNAGTTLSQQAAKYQTNAQVATVDQQTAFKVLDQFGQDANIYVDPNLVYTVTPNGNQAHSYVIEAAENHNDYIHLVYRYVFNIQDHSAYSLFGMAPRDNRPASTQPTVKVGSQLDVSDKPISGATADSQNASSNQAVQSTPSNSQEAQNSSQAPSVPTNSAANINSNGQAQQAQTDPNAYHGTTLPQTGNTNPLAVTGLGLASLWSLFGLIKFN